MQELADKVWANPLLHRQADRLRRAWLAAEIGADRVDPLTTGETARLVEAAAILACSARLDHRRNG